MEKCCDNPLLKLNWDNNDFNKRKEDVTCIQIKDRI